MGSPGKNLATGADFEKPNLTVHTPEEGENDREYQRRISGLRDTFSSYVAEVRRTGAAGDEDIQNLEKGLQYVPEEDIEGWKKFLDNSRQSASELRDHLDRLLSQSSGLISSQSANEWVRRFEDRSATFKQKEYFVKNELPRRMKNWEEVMDERDTLATSANIALLKRFHLPELAKLQNKETFKGLKYDEKLHIVSAIRAALKAKESKQDPLYHIAWTRLNAAAAEGVLSKKKIGVWLKRIFDEQNTPEKMQQFLQGSGTDSLTGLLRGWKTAKARFDVIDAKLGKSENIARGFNRITVQQFLDMHYDQRMSYVREAERVLQTSKNIDKENPRLLKIRHLLDIEDWETADEEIRAAHYDELSQEDRSRLQSMRQYLKEHRTDGGTQKKENPQMESVVTAKNGIDEILKSMDGGMAGIAERLIPAGNEAVARWRWTVYNYVWCQKNGFVNQEKAQQRAQAYRDVTKERHEQQQDLGTNDVAIDDAYLRNDEHMKEGMRKGKEKATYQIVNLQNPNVASSVASWYKKSHDTKVLYWTTFVGCDSEGRTKSDGWHKQQFALINQLRTYTKTLENAGLRWRGRGIPLGRISQDAPEEAARSAA